MTHLVRIASAAAVALASTAAAAQPRESEYDVVVYGGTAGGVVAAVAAGRQGASVALLEPRRHLGGMVSGGLGRTDFGRRETIGGISLEFFQRVGKHYGEPIGWFFEPHVAEQTFEELAREAGVMVFREHRLESVTKDGARIVRITCKNGVAFPARIFVDATYEGDLMARAGVSYHVGRESRDTYGESLAGVTAVTPKHQFDAPISPYDENGELLPEINAPPYGKPGEGDRKIQAYNFRLCLCDRKENQVPITKPAGYDPRRYELLARYLEKKPDTPLGKLLSIAPMPNGKTDINNNGPFSTDHIGANWDYPDADYRTREKIWQDHVRYVQGLLYFLGSDRCVPEHIRKEMSRYGYAKDEFVDTGHWPHQLYVREARRMVGAYVMTEKDCRSERLKPDSIGMGSYNIDTHNAQRLVTPDGTVRNEGDIQVGVAPYEIPYRSLTPKRAECDNLLVPVCVSASHIAYGSIRMEPVYMLLGHACGVAAQLAVSADAPVQAIDVGRLQKILLEQSQVLHWRHPLAVDVSTLKGLVVDDEQAVTKGAWTRSSAVGPFVGTGYLHDGAEDVEKAVRFTPEIAHGGRYRVRLFHSPHGNRAGNVPVVVRHAEGTTKVIVDERKASEKGAAYTDLGVYRFDPGREGYVEVRTKGADGYVIADAAWFLPAD